MITVVVASIHSMLLVTACGGRQHVPAAEPTPPAKTLSVADEALKFIASRQIETYVSPFGDRVFPPKMSSIKLDPGLALGTLFARVALPGKTCDSNSVEDFRAARLRDVRNKDDDSQCKVKDMAPLSLAMKRVKGGGSAELSAIIGEVAAKGEYIFELGISEPTAAVFESVSDCIDENEFSKIVLPAQTCEVSYIVGAVTTQFTYKKLKSYTADMKGSFSMVNVGGQIYCEEGDTEAKTVLTVDILDISSYFPKKNGFLVGSKKKGDGVIDDETLKKLGNGKTGILLRTAQEKGTYLKGVD
jgi:hypothetical protein